MVGQELFFRVNVLERAQYKVYDNELPGPIKDAVPLEF
jgi:hypothetical protein